ncbi:MAG: hemerythrin domain-containing protein, partial [Magnetococcus sp. YQC-5]
MAKILSIQGIPDELQERMAYVAHLHKISLDELVLIACSDWMSRHFQEAWHKGQKDHTLQPPPSLATQPYYDVVLDHAQNTPSDKIIELIDLLRIEHGIIKESLNDIHKVGIKTHTGKKIFSTLFDLLKTHLKKEEKFVYPAFKNFVTDNKNINDLLLSAYAQEYLLTSTIIQ